MKLERWALQEFDSVWDEIWPIYSEAFTNGSYAGQELDPAYSRRLCRGMFEQGGFGFFAKDSQRYAGFVIVAPIACDGSLPDGFSDEKAISIAELAIRRNYRGQGIGSLLVQKSLAETQGTVFVRTSSNNGGAIRFYERLGFECIADVERKRMRFGRTEVQLKTYLRLQR